MKEMHQRLAAARKDAGYPTAAAAAEALGVKQPTYLGHENGSRGFKKANAELYARKFGVSLEWLLTGKGARGGKAAPAAASERQVPLVGYVGAGAATHFFPHDAPIDEVSAPTGSTASTVAVEIRGESLGTFFDRWLVFYDDVRRPVTPDLINKLCVVGLDDGRILIKKIQKSKARGLFHLLSQTEPPILDVAIEWAARVKNLVPR
ncbi:helix-turn-helix transcriptional regulator [Bradyrhizobium sp. USDA 4545]|uniref:LexA family transcriptional regulator n=1 Tax=Bradyrhizobium sp. USDA 4545 TaxID=2817705 RepID=UPI0020A50DC6|nr:helix-turn-helix transcriptional regulator [Bradyrhizobium sp. USDA 4545]MCP1832788.1 phage repressor protein C with HTH and peptisase S24 domain [Bradyrhizobium sp. USDA 4545]